MVDAPWAGRPMSEAMALLRLSGSALAACKGVLSKTAVLKVCRWSLQVEHGQLPYRLHTVLQGCTP